MMIPTGTPQKLRPARFPIPTRSVDRHRCRLVCLSLICSLLAVGMGEILAADPADPVAAEGQDHDAVAPPIGEDAVPEPADWSMSPDDRMPPGGDEFLSRLQCDDCCPLFDDCCPGYDDCGPVFDDCCGCLDDDLCCFDPGDDGCDALGGCCRADATFYFGTEFGILKPDVDSLALPGTTAQSSITPDHSFEFAPRFFGGFQTCDGWGGQISYWTLETGGSRTNLPQVLHELDLQTVDVDFLKTCEVGDWSIQIGAGGRWGEIESSYFSLVNPNQRLVTDFEGTGPTAVLNVRRPLGSGSWAIVGEGRASFLYGDTTVDAPLAPTLTIGDDWVKIWEGRAGVEWTGASASGNSLFFVRALFEGQYWNVPSVGPAGSPDLNFLGPTVSVGFVF